MPVTVTVIVIRVSDVRVSRCPLRPLKVWVPCNFLRLCLVTSGAVRWQGEGRGCSSTISRPGPQPIQQGRMGRGRRRPFNFPNRKKVRTAEKQIQLAKVSVISGISCKTYVAVVFVRRQCKNRGNVRDRKSRPLQSPCPSGPGSSECSGALCSRSTGWTGLAR